MASEWKTVRLGNLAKINSGYAFKSSDMGEFGVPIVKIKNITPPSVDIQDVERIPEEVIKNIPNIERYKLEDGDILIAMTGATVGKVGRLPKTQETFYLNQRVGKVFLRDKKAANYDFLYYVLSQPHYVQQMFGLADGSAQANISGSQIEDLEVSLPPLPEQRAIAHILGTLDDKIELNRRMSQTLEQMARALFKAWFVDFEPVRAKMEGRWRRGQSLPGMPAELYDLFPDRLVDSPLGPIPQGWEVSTLACYASLNPESWSKADYPDTIVYVDLSNTKWGRIETVTRYKRAEAPSRAQRILRPGDTIVGTVRPGNGSYALILEDGLTGSTGFAVLRPLTPEAREFVYLAATRVENIEALSHLADGGAYPAVRPEVVLGTSVVKPPTDVVRQFSAATKDLLGRIGACEHESRTLAALRDALLPKLISGEIRVKDAERFLKERGL